MERYVRGRPVRLTLEVRDSDGDLVDVDAATQVTAEVVDPDGAALAGSPFTAGRDGTGTYSVQLGTTPQVLGVHQVTWHYTLGGYAHQQLAFFELVGGFLFEVHELRAFDAALQMRSAAEIAAARDVVTERFETWCGVSFVPVGRRVRLDGDGTSLLLLPDLQVRRLLAVSVDGVALDAAQLAELQLDAASGIVTWQGGRFSPGVANVAVAYEAGYDAPPAPVRRAALRYAKHLLVQSAVDDRATAVFTDVGGFRLTLAGRDGPTGLPEVDAVLAEYGLRLPAVG